MYKGNNPSALSSQKMLLDSFNELLKGMEFKEISVSKLCSHSGVSRQTFYSLFGSKENIFLHQLELAKFAQQPKPEDVTNMKLMEICKRSSDFIISNYNQIKMLIENDLMELFNILCYEAMYSCRESFVELDNDELEYASIFISAGLCRLTQRYLLHNVVPDQDELTQILYKIMSGSIYRI